MDDFGPGASILGGKYRLERLVVAHDAVTVWEATDLHSGQSVQLSVFERGSAMLDHGRIDDGMFFVFAAPPRHPARLELVEISDEDAFFDEPPAPELFDVPTSRPSRVRLWGAAAALLAGVVFGLGALYVAHGRTTATSETTITAAPLPTSASPQSPPPPPPEAPSARPERHEAPTPRVSPAPHAAPKRLHLARPAPRRTPPPPNPSDPITL